jgi:tetratricopeptide (TPR) repeat protein
VLGPVTCRACGAKVREDRARCLRCGAALIAAGPARRHASIRTIAMVAGVIAAAGVATFIAGRPTRPANAAPLPTTGAADSPNDPSARAPGPPPGAAGRSATAVTSMDVARQGLAAYNRGDVTGSVEQFTAAVQADPQNADAQNNLGQVLVRTGRTRDAIPHFDQAIALSDGTWAYHFNRARAYADLKEWSRAVAGYRDAARLFPEDYITAFNLAKALQAGGDLPAAIAEYERAIVLAPAQADFHLSHAFALETASKPREAAAAYRRFLELEESSPQAEKIKARIAQLESQS